MKELLMGNEAIAQGAIDAGVGLISGYPGTPSTEILEYAAKKNDGSIYVEWSVNEKAAVEVAAGASYSGVRTLVTMKQVGLNVASDPVMSLSYIGVKGGMVIVSADDPGPISSQTEQDTRKFASFSKIPCFDPSSPEEAYEMVKQAFELSEKHSTPVFLRPTTRVCHGRSVVQTTGIQEKRVPEGFIKDSNKWVIFPRLSHRRHGEIEKRNPQIGDEFYNSPFNIMSGSGKKGIITGGISYAYTMEALNGYNDVKILKIGTPFPFPYKLALDFIEGLDEVLCIEELDPILESALLELCGRNGIKLTIKGKTTGHMPFAGENSTELIKQVLSDYIGLPSSIEDIKLPSLPVRPPVLCAGCPHRASFFAVKRAMKGKKAVFTGDIGCYTLGNAAPLEMVDTCLCMGADVTIAQGIKRTNDDTTVFAFIGDSTFFASGITGIVNAVYNQTDINLIILDNSTTAMTGQQPHPGTGVTMMKAVSEKVDIKALLKAIGVPTVKKVNPFNQDEAVRTIKAVTEAPGVSAVIFEAPCIALYKPDATYVVNDSCIRCKKCIKLLGCPALSMKNGQAVVDTSLCYGCGLCTDVCPCSAIERKVL